jgi:predicted permease
MTAGIRRFCSRLINAVRPWRREPALAREIASHLALAEDEYRRRGLPPDEARRAARIALGGIEQTKELHRTARSLAWLDAVRRDALYGVRMLWRQPIVTGAAVLSLALGVGLNAAVFSVVDWVLLRPLPLPAPREIVRVFTAGTAPVTAPAPLTSSEVGAIARASAFRASGAYSIATRAIEGVGIEPAHIAVARVAGDWFGTLQVLPETGRVFSLEEISGGAPVVILSHRVWLRVWRGEPVTGRPLTIDGVPHTIVGVMPARRGYPEDAELWRPLTAEEREDDDRELNLIGRLRPGASIDRASAQVASLALSVSKATRTAWAEDIQRTGVRNVRTALNVLLAAAAFVLLIVCANVASLVGARAADRTSELRVRRALGATRARLLGQSLVETGVLTLAGGLLGLLVGRASLAVLVSIAPPDLPRLSEIALDTRILAFSLAATVLIALAVGIMPAAQCSRSAEGSAPGGVGSRSTRRSRGRRTLVMAQVALALVLTIGAGLLTRSLQNLVTIDHGFVPDRLISVHLYLKSFDGDTQPLYRELIASAEAIPGVSSAAVVMRLPTQVGGIRAMVSPAGASQPPAPAVWRPVTPGYFETAGIPITAGRSFAATDLAHAPRVAIVNVALMRSLGGSTVGSRMTTSLTDSPVAVIGVVPDVTPGGEAERPAIYVPVDQNPIGSASLLVRTHDDPSRIMPALAARVRAISPGLPLDRIQLVAEALAESRSATRFNATLTTTFAGLALLLSMIGVYGLVATDVTARWRELAVRLALGASHRGALWTVLRPSAVVMAGGIVVGLIGALSVGPAVRSLLHGVGSTDLLTFAVVPALLAATGILAASLAAARVLRANPAATLRSE